LIIIRNVEWAPNQLIGMVSEGSCDVTLERNEEMMLKIQLCQHRNKLHLNHVDKKPSVKVIHAF